MRAAVKRSGRHRLGEVELQERPRSKLVGSAGCLIRLEKGSGDFAATVRVSEAGYVPPATTLRTRIGPCLFTASIPAARLAELEADPAVVSIQPAERLEPQAGP